MGTVLISVIASVASRDGGTTSTVLALASELRALGFRNVIETTDADGYRHRLPSVAGTEQVVAGAPVCFHTLHQPKRLKASVGQSRHIWSRTRRADVVHIHGLYLACTVVAAATCWVRRVPYVIQPHGGLEPYHQRKSRRVKRAWDVVVGERILRKAYAIVCASPSEAKNVADRGLSNAVVIPHGVSHTEGAPSPEIERRLDDWGSETVVLYLGRLTRKKHPELLVDAWGQLPRGAARLVVVGPDDDWTADQLRGRLKDAETSAEIEFLGALGGTDKWAVLNRADLFCLPSESENFGVTVPEALVAGTACVVTTDVATAQDVRLAGSGWVLEDLSLDAWVAQLAAAVLDPLGLAAKGRAARNYAAALYDWQKVAHRYISLYEDAILQRENVDVAR